MSRVMPRILHLIRHAESEFNVLSNGTLEGFVSSITSLDANLTPHGFNQASNLGNRILTESINGYNPDDILSIKNTDVVITSPMTRTILTALNSLPFNKYKYIIRPEITEQIENTTDIPLSPHNLILKFPYLSSQISLLPECWWYRHPNISYNDNNPYSDANILHKFSGEIPASESKEYVRRRILWFFKWLYQYPQINYNNITIYSHSCTIFEMEKYLNNNNNNKSVSMLKNAEVRSYLIDNNESISNTYNDIQYYDIFNDEHIWNNFDGYYTLNSCYQS